MPAADTAAILQAAIALRDAGCTVVPTRKDGGKAPAGKWKEYQENPPTGQQLAEWFGLQGHTGIGIICGKASRNVEMAELEARAMSGLDAVEQLADNTGLRPLYDRVTEGWSEWTPTGGVHWYYRITDGIVPGNTKLATAPDGLVLAETRGEGGFSVVAPSHGNVHPTGQPWVIACGGPLTMAEITWDERAAFLSLLQSLDTPAKTAEPATASPTAHDGLRPGDDYNERGDWQQILTGWTRLYTDNAGVTYWRRPGKNDGISATTGRNDGDNLYVFSTSTPFDTETAYSKFAAYTTLHHGGDWTAAAKELARLGYGSEIAGLPPLTPISLEQADQPAANQTEAEPTAEQLRRQMLLAREMEEQGVRREAKRLLDDHEHAKAFREPAIVRHLGDELAIEDDPLTWAVEDLFPEGSNVLLTAAYKSGKTTLVNHLVKCLADAEPFLDKYWPAAHPRRIVVFNYEVGASQYKEWMRQVGIVNHDKVTLVHLRGMRMPLTSRRIEDWVVGTLKDLDAHTWVVDPFARAFTGSGDENSNSDVGVFLDTLDVVKERAGVANLLLPAHTGRNAELGIDRARGATRLDDWADVRWLLNKNQNGDRFLSADGRDVSMDECMLGWDERTRSLTVAGQIGRRQRNSDVVLNKILEVVAANPGITSGQLEKAVKAKHADFADAKKKALEGYMISEETIGSNKLYRLVGLRPFDV